MSRPRRHYGPTPPGQLLATMLKVLAAEVSDSGRLARGRRYFETDSVTDIEVEPGRVEAVVQGSRPAPYEVMIATRRGEGMPRTSDLAASCSCPDAASVRFCKHSIAAMFALANEVAIEPELLKRWRRESGPADAETGEDTGDGVVIELFGDRSEATDGPRPTSPEPERDHTIDEVNALLVGPRAGDAIDSPFVPDLGPIEPVPQRPSGDAAVDRLLRQLHDELDLGW